MDCVYSIQMDTHRDTEREKWKRDKRDKRDKETGRETDKDTDIETDIERDTDTDQGRQSVSQTDRHRSYRGRPASVKLARSQLVGMPVCATHAITHTNIYTPTDVGGVTGLVSH